ncbi:asparagine synthase [Microbacterium sp.]|uniref:asparagine synthase n=1 Tax=Microbacterium sp. TaxID=51671 RepID=UPI003A8AC0A4
MTHLGRGEECAGRKIEGEDAVADEQQRERSPQRARNRDVVAEGMYIASAATRLDLKNRILVHMLVDGDTFDADSLLPEARESLLALAEEAELDAERTGRERKSARGRHADSHGTHDYRSRDVRNLRRRQKQSLRVAAELRTRAADEDQLRLLIADAREAAWSEVASNIDRSLRISAARPDLEPDYERMRAARMQALRLVDLPKLRAHRRVLDAHSDDPS